MQVTEGMRNRAEAFTKLGKITQEKQQIEGRLQVLIATEKELYEFLEIPHPGTKEKPRKKHITREKAIGIRRQIIVVMKELNDKGLTWLPMQLIVARVNQEMPAALIREIEAQIRLLAASESSPVSHNGLRGNGSCYSTAQAK